MRVLFQPDQGDGAAVPGGIAAAEFLPGKGRFEGGARISPGEPHTVFIAAPFRIIGGAERGGEQKAGAKRDEWQPGQFFVLR